MTTTRRDQLDGPLDHEHTHSLYVHCLDCQMFGIDLPTPFTQAAECGNCGSMQTVKYFPSCCMLAMYDAAMSEKSEREKALVEAAKLVHSLHMKDAGYVNFHNMLGEALVNLEVALKAY